MIIGRKYFPANDLQMMSKKASAPNIFTARYEIISINLCIYLVNKQFGVKILSRQSYFLETGKIFWYIL